MEEFNKAKVTIDLDEYNYLKNEIVELRAVLPIDLETLSTIASLIASGITGSNLKDAEKAIEDKYKYLNVWCDVDRLSGIDYNHRGFSYPRIHIKVNEEYRK